MKQAKLGYSSANTHWTDRCSDCKAWDEQVRPYVEKQIKELWEAIERREKGFFIEFDEDAKTWMG